MATEKQIGGGDWKAWMVDGTTDPNDFRIELVWNGPIHVALRAHAKGIAHAICRATKEPDMRLGLLSMVLHELATEMHTYEGEVKAPRIAAVGAGDGPRPIPGPGSGRRG